MSCWRISGAAGSVSAAWWPSSPQSAELIDEPHGYVGVASTLAPLESALARPEASAFGEAAYPTIHLRAAALLHSLARNHALVDGNRRLALAATIAFYGINGMRLTFTNDQADELVINVACRTLDEVPRIASVLEPRTEPR